MINMLGVGGNGLVTIVYILLVAFFLVAILLEAMVIMLMKYNKRPGKVFLDSLLVNLGSISIAILLFYLFDSFFSNFSLFSVTILFLIITAVEAGLLRLLNRNHSWRASLRVSAVMNLVTSLLLYLVGQAS
jgi:hypothetical protein